MKTSAKRETAIADARNNKKYNNLHIEIAFGKPNKCEPAFLQNICKFPIDGKTLDGKTPLQLAIENKSSAKFMKLVEKGADIHHESEHGSLLQTAVAVKCIPIVEYFLAKGFEVDDKNERGETALHTFCKNFYYTSFPITNKLVSILLTRSKRLDIKDNRQNTPFFYLLEKLKSLKRIPDPDQPYGIYDGMDVVEMFLKHGAKVTDVLKELPEILHLAVAARNKTFYRVCMKQNPKVSPGKCGETLLHTAAFFNNCEMIEPALLHGIDIDTPMEMKLTALHLCVMNRYHHIIVTLINLGANVNAQDEFGQTPLHYAIEYRFHVATWILLNSNASMDIKNNQGKTARQIGLEDDRYDRTDGFHEKIETGLSNTFPRAFFGARTYKKNAEAKIIIAHNYSFLRPEDPVVTYYLTVRELRNRVLHMSVQELKDLLDEGTPQRKKQRTEEENYCVRLAKEVMILRNSTSMWKGVTLYDFVTQSSFKMAPFCMSKRIDLDIDISEYFYLVNNKLNDVRRLNLRKLAICELSQILEMGLPVEIMEKVTSYLNEYQMRFLLKKNSRKINAIDKSHATDGMLEKGLRHAANIPAH